MRRLSLLFLIATLAGCVGSSSGSAPASTSATEPTSSVYRCEGGQTVEASYPTDSTTVVEYEGQTLQMTLAVSASGARYVGGELEWWTKGTGPGSEGMLLHHESDGTSGAVVASSCVQGTGRPAEADPSQTALEKRLREMYPPYLGEVRYFQGRTDLDEDGDREAVVHMVGPAICGTGGCETLVLIREAEGWQRIAEISVARAPVVAAATKTNGWHDLVVAVGGGGIASPYNARLRFDGETYPGNPTVEPAQRAEAHPRGTVLIEPYQSFTEGRLLRRGSE